MFAPTDSPRWKNFVTILIEQNEWELLETVTKMRPVEVKDVVNELRKKKKPN
jgi:hypothetical protein